MWEGAKPNAKHRSHEARASRFRSHTNDGQCEIAQRASLLMTSLIVAGERSRLTLGKSRSAIERFAIRSPLPKPLSYKNTGGRFNSRITKENIASLDRRIRPVCDVFLCSN